MVVFARGPPSSVACKTPASGTWDVLEVRFPISAGYALYHARA
jgi:hypothetical protein